jgi:hypothetical protein
VSLFMTVAPGLPEPWTSQQVGRRSAAYKEEMDPIPWTEWPRDHGGLSVCFHAAAGFLRLFALSAVGSQRLVSRQLDGGILRIVMRRER